MIANHPEHHAITNSVLIKGNNSGYQIFVLLLRQCTKKNRQICCRFLYVMSVLCIDNVMINPYNFLLWNYS